MPKNDVNKSLVLLNDAIEQSRPFFEEPSLESDGQEQLQKDEAKKSLKSLEEELNSENWDGFDQTKAQEIISKVCKSSGMKKGILMKSLRAALLGKLQGPDLITTWGLLARIGQDRIRLRRVL